MTTNEKKRGWGFPINSRKAHYFIGAMSLCGKWIYAGRLEDDNHKSPDNCVSCQKKRVELTPTLPNNISKQTGEV